MVRHCKRCKGLPTGVWEVLARCLAVAPSARYAAWAKVAQTLAALYTQEVGQALPESGAAIAVSREARVVVGWSYNAIGASYLDLGQAERALSFFGRAQQVGQAEEERVLESAGLNHLGLSYANLGDTRQAIGYHEQALAIAQEIGDRSGEVTVLGNLGTNYRDLGDLQRGLTYSQMALAVFREIGARKQEAEELSLQGSTYARLGSIGEAKQRWQEGLAIAEEIDDRLVAGNCSYKVARVLASEGDMHQALVHARRGLELYRQIDRPDWARDAQTLVAQLEDRVVPNSPISNKILRQFGPLIAAAITAARGDVRARHAVENAFDTLNQNGWQVAEPIRSIWAGERNEAALTNGLDSYNALVVRAILQQL